MDVVFLKKLENGSSVSHGIRGWYDPHSEITGSRQILKYKIDEDKINLNFRILAALLPGFYRCRQTPQHSFHHVG